jgi:hypothetical protein
MPAARYHDHCGTGVVRGIDDVHLDRGRVKVDDALEAAGDGFLLIVLLGPALALFLQVFRAGGNSATIWPPGTIGWGTNGVAGVWLRRTATEMPSSARSAFEVLSMRQIIYPVDRDPGSGVRGLWYLAVTGPLS